MQYSLQCKLPRGAFGGALVAGGIMRQYSPSAIEQKHNVHTYRLHRARNE